MRRASETLPRLGKSSKSSSPTPRNSPRQLWGAAMAGGVPFPADHWCQWDTSDTGKVEYVFSCWSITILSIKPRQHHGNMHHFVEDTLRNSFYHLHHVYLCRSIKVILHRPWYLSRYRSISGIIISFCVCDKCMESHPILEEKLPMHGDFFFPAMFKRVKKMNVPSKFQLPGGPMPVISRVITPFIGVITPVTHLKRPFMMAP